MKKKPVPTFKVAAFLKEAPDAVVSINGATTITRAQMLADWQAACQALQTLAVPRFALFEEDTYRFLVWLLAAWENGQTAVLPPEDLPTVREQLTIPWVGQGKPENALQTWLYSDKEGTGKTMVRDAVGTSKPQDRMKCELVGALRATPLQNTPVHSDNVEPPFTTPGVAFFTSGSTGEARLIFKRPEQLWREAEALNRVFGANFPPEVRFAGMVPHQHMFGLPFRVFFPFCSGHPILTTFFRYPEDLLGLVPGKYVLISSPATLKRLVQLPHVQPKADILAVFAAGSPLPVEVALATRDQLKTTMIEIYGSTETGYVAHRVAPEVKWHPQPGVVLAVDEETGCLKIRSPLLPDDNWYQTQDRVRIDEDGWQILGRADRIAKIEGQRVSLDTVEAAVKAQPEVSDVRATPIYGEREEVVAAVVLSELGRATLADIGKLPFERMLRQRLRPLLTRAALPRRWRFLSELPRNAMGKITQQDVARLFQARPLPVVEVLERSEFRARLRLPLNQSLFAFDGHFPTLPVLPGVTQVDWAIRLAQRYLALDHHCDVEAMSTIGQLKFQRLVRPGDSLFLTLILAPEKKQLSFSYALEANPETVTAQATVRFQRGEEK